MPGSEKDQGESITLFRTAFTTLGEKFLELMLIFFHVLSQNIAINVGAISCWSCGFLARLEAFCNHKNPPSTSPRECFAGGAAAVVPVVGPVLHSRPVTDRTSYARGLEVYWPWSVGRCASQNSHTIGRLCRGSGWNGTRLFELVGSIPTCLCPMCSGVL